MAAVTTSQKRAWTKWNSFEAVGYTNKVETSLGASKGRKEDPVGVMLVPNSNRGSALRRSLSSLFPSVRSFAPPGCRVPGGNALKRFEAKATRSFLTARLYRFFLSSALADSWRRDEKIVGKALVRANGKRAPRLLQDAFGRRATARRLLSQRLSHGMRSWHALDRCPKRFLAVERRSSVLFRTRHGR